MKLHGMSESPSRKTQTLW